MPGRWDRSKKSLETTTLSNGTQNFLESFENQSPLFKVTKYQDPLSITRLKKKNVSSYQLTHLFLSFLGGVAVA